MPDAPPRREAAVRRLPLKQASDAEIAVAAARGDASAQATAWDRYAPLVRGLLRRSFGPDGAVDDLAQEVFLRFFDRLPTLREAGSVRAFLIGITMRVAAGELRRRRVRRWLRLSDTGTPPEIEDSPLDPEAREALARLYAILDEQSDEARLAFVLRHVEGLELTEVAAGLGVSLATAKRKLARTVPRIFARIEADPLLSAYADRGGPDEQA